MKKIFILILFTFVLCFAYSDDSADNEAIQMDIADEFDYYAGLMLVPVKSSGFEDICFSDWENYGLKSVNSSSAEARVLLPLEQANGNGLAVGLLLGAEYPVIPEMLVANAELQFAYGSGYIVSNLMLGASYRFIDNDTFFLGVMPKIGFTMLSVQLGELEVISGYTPPVIIDQGTFRDGDAMSGMIFGFDLQPVIEGGYKLMNLEGMGELAIVGQVGWNQGFLSGFQLNVTPSGSDESVTIDGDDPALVKNDGSGTQADIDPIANSNGLFISIGARIGL